MKENLCVFFGEINKFLSQFMFAFREDSFQLIKNFLKNYSSPYFSRPKDVLAFRVKSSEIFVQIEALFIVFHSFQEPFACARFNDMTI